MPELTGGEVQTRKKKLEEGKRRKEREREKRGSDTENKQHLKESRRKTETP